MINPIKEVHTIVLHKGGAHTDDVTALMMALAFAPKAKTVYRRDPTGPELINPEVLILDVGGVLDPNFNNLDRHQDRAAPAAFALLLIHLGLMERFTMGTRWAKIASDMDTKGPYAVAAEMNVLPRAVIDLVSGPENMAMISLMEETHDEAPMAEDHVTAFRVLGQALHKKVVTTAALMMDLQVNAKVTDVGGVMGFVAEGVPVDQDQATLFHDLHMAGAGWCAVGDDRGEGMACYRFDDHPGVNFATYGAGPNPMDGVIFALPFVLKSESPDWIKVQPLIARCINSTK